MVKLTKIYTRGGDGGETSLGDGARVKKHDLRVAAYGAIDEANAAIGVARQHTMNVSDLDTILARLQNELFDLGADICVPSDNGDQNRPRLRVSAHQVAALEGDIDRLNADLPPLTSFILPGGSAAAAALHVARTTTRRAERELTALAERETVNLDAIAYINRLSDLLFVMARAANRLVNSRDVLWVPGQSRG